MQKQRKIPLRQCIACRELKEKKAMLRVVKNSAGEIFLDFSGKAAVRGAYVCDQPDCIPKLKAKRMIDRAFSCKVDDKVYTSIEEEYFGRKS